MPMSLPVSTVVRLVEQSRKVEVSGKETLALVAEQVEAMRGRSARRVALLSTKEAVPTLKTLVDAWAEAEADMQYLAKLVEASQEGLHESLRAYVELLSTTCLAAADINGKT